MNITHLPEEILIKIFGQLSTFEILRRIPIVCKKFYTISKVPSLISEIKFIDHPFDKNTVDFSVLTGIKKLIIQGRFDVDNLIYNAIVNCPKLYHLEIKDCPLTQEAFTTLIYSDLKLQILNFDSLHHVIGIQKITTLKSLRYLKLHNLAQSTPILGNMGNLYERDILNSNDLIKISQNCIKLEGLSINDEYHDLTTNFTEESINILLEARQNTLTELQLVRKANSLSNQAFQNLSNCHHMRVLQLGYTFHLDEILAKTISSLHNLETLQLTFVRHVTEENYVQMFNNKSLQMLVHLDLTGCFKISNDVIKSIALNCPRLECLIIKDCPKCWTDKGLEIIPLNCPARWIL